MPVATQSAVIRIKPLLTEREAKRRVKRGAKVLDRERPGWFKQATVKLSKLDLSSSCKCVLGQVFEDDATGSEYDGYDAGLRLIAVQADPYNWAEMHGFDTPSAPKTCRWTSTSTSGSRQPTRPSMWPTGCSVTPGSKRSAADALQRRR